jgi:small-conductance mechanosensitive channel
LPARRTRRTIGTLCNINNFEQTSSISIFVALMYCLTNNVENWYEIAAKLKRLLIMQLAYTPYILPLLLAIFIALFLAARVWKHRKRPVAATFLVLMFAWYGGHLRRPLNTSALNCP